MLSPEERGGRGTVVIFSTDPCGRGVPACPQFVLICRNDVQRLQARLEEAPILGAGRMPGVSRSVHAGFQVLPAPREEGPPHSVQCRLQQQALYGVQMLKTEAAIHGFDPNELGRIKYIGARGAARFKTIPPPMRVRYRAARLERVRRSPSRRWRRGGDSSSQPPTLAEIAGRFRRRCR